MKIPLILTPWRITKPKFWHFLVLIIIILLIISKTQAFNNILPFNPTVVQPQPPTLPSKSVGEYVFNNFNAKLNQWLGGSIIKPPGSEYLELGIYQKLSNALRGILIWVLTLLLIFAGFAFYFSQLSKALLPLSILIIKTVFVITLLDYSLFSQWILTPLMDLVVGVISILLPNNNNSNDIAGIVFGTVDNYFVEIFDAIKAYYNNISLNLFGGNITNSLLNIFAAFTLMLGFAGLYAIFGVLMVLGFFGAYIMFAVMPIVLVLFLINKQFLYSWMRTTFNYLLIPIFTATVMSVTLHFLNGVAVKILKMDPTDSIFTADFGVAIFIAIFSIGLHWKAPEFAAGISGGVVSGAGSIVGTVAAVGGGAWALTRGTAYGGANFTSGFRGGTAGNEGSGAYRAGQSFDRLYEKYLKGGTK